MLQRPSLGVDEGETAEVVLVVVEEGAEAEVL